MIDQDGIELSDAQMVALSGGCGKKKLLPDKHKVNLQGSIRDPGRQLKEGMRR